ncbi:MAG: hypothetical protein GY700_13525 [Propionibacteriaceae bacterium]|nr:hypothetical protein [Propionibacteriaceae bacterium]
MADTLALEKLYNNVVARFVTDSTNVPNVFGWRKPANRGAQQNRICWVPGDPSGAAGEVVAAHNPGGNPRAIGTLIETFTVYVEGRDSSNPENELAQYKAARLIFDSWFRAAYLSVKNLLTVKSTTWMVERTTRRYGATIRAVCTVQAEIPDLAYEIAEDVEAVADMQLDGDDDEGTPNASEDMDVPPLEEP